MNAEIVVNIKPQVDQLRGVYTSLSKGQFNTAVGRGINRTLLQGRTDARKAVKQVYTVSQSALPNKIDIIRANRNKLWGAVTASTKPVPMEDFKFKFKSSQGVVTTGSKRSYNGVKALKSSIAKRKQGQGVLVLEAQRGVVQQLPYAFIIPSLSGKIFGRGVYKPGSGSYGFHKRKAGEPRPRTNSGGTNEKVTPLTSVTIYAAAINSKTQVIISNKITSVFQNNIIHELEFQLSKSNG